MIEPVRVGGRVVEQQAVCCGVWGKAAQGVMEVTEVPGKPAIVRLVAKGLEEMQVVTVGNKGSVAGVDQAAVVAEAKVETKMVGIWEGWWEEVGAAWGAGVGNSKAE